MPYSISAAKTKMKQTDTNRSMAVTYDTLGRDFLAMVLSVVMVSTVVMPGEEMREYGGNLSSWKLGPYAWSTTVCITRAVKQFNLKKT